MKGYERFQLRPFGTKEIPVSFNSSIILDHILPFCEITSVVHKLCVSQKDGFNSALLQIFL